MGMSLEDTDGGGSPEMHGSLIYGHLLKSARFSLPAEFQTHQQWSEMVVQ